MQFTGRVKSPSSLVRTCSCVPCRASFLPPLGQVGDKIYFKGANETFPGGDKVIYGQQGEVTGLGTGEFVGCVAVLFPGNKGNINCSVVALSKEPPGPLPGGFEAM